MLDINFIREHADLAKQAAANKNVTVDIDALLRLDEKRRELQIARDALGKQKNELARQTREGKPTKEQITAGKNLKEELQKVEEEQQMVEEQFYSLLETVPNIPTLDTPIGQDESKNKILRQVGKPPTPDFPPKEHWQLGAELGLIDNETAARVSGSRFTYLKNELVLLEFSLLRYAFDTLTQIETLQEIAGEAGVTPPQKPFTPIAPPHMVRTEVMQKMARLEPREDRYYLPEDDVYLIGSAEHTLGPMHMNHTFAEEDLPVRYVAFSPSYRREAGSHGKDVRGILRLHQFDKIEMESFTTSETALEEQDLLVALQEHFMKSLELPYRVVLLCTGEMGGPDARQVDIETWLPGQNRYRETHTADYMTDYQARRLRTKVKRASGEAQYVHMNDATVFAMGRTVVAIMENHQQPDGSIAIPKALHPYLPFTSIPAKQ